MSRRLRNAIHLVARFFDVLFSAPLRPSEQAEVARLLRSDAERTMFWDQPFADQRHGLDAARHVAARMSTRPELVRAAMLHDVGKRHSRLGVLGRVFASLVRATGGTGSGRVEQYLSHGPLGAADLRAAGAEPMVVAYAHHHHGPRPSSLDIEDWELLDAADRARHRS